MSTVSGKRVDAFIRQGRIGPRLLDALNITNNTTFQLHDCAFYAFLGEDGYACVSVHAGGKEYEVRVRQLHLIMGKKMSKNESDFFKKLDIGLI